MGKAKPDKQNARRRCEEYAWMIYWTQLLHVKSPASRGAKDKGMYTSEYTYLICHICKLAIEDMNISEVLVKSCVAIMRTSKTFEYYLKLKSVNSYL